MKQTIDLVTVDFGKGENNDRTYWTLRFHPAELSFMDRLLGRQPQINEGEFTFVARNRKRFRNTDGALVGGVVEQALEAFSDTLMFSYDYDDYDDGVKLLPEQSFYVLTHELGKGYSTAPSGVYLYPSFDEEIFG